SLQLKRVSRRRGEQIEELLARANRVQAIAPPRGKVKASVAEVPDAGADHGDLALIGGGDDLGVLDASTRLDRARRAGFGGGEEAVGEREERIAADGAAFERQAGVLSLPDGDAAGIDPRHLTRADTEG